MTRFSPPFIAALLFVINLCPATPCNAENGFDYRAVSGSGRRLSILS